MKKYEKPMIVLCTFKSKNIFSALSLVKEAANYGNIDNDSWDIFNDLFK